MGIPGGGSSSSGSSSLLLAPPPSSSSRPGPQRGLTLLTDVMREALGVLQLVEQSRQDEKLALGLRLKELSRLVASTVGVCQQALQALTSQLLALLGPSSSSSSSGSSSSSRYAARSAVSLPVPMPAAAAAAVSVSMPAAAATAPAAPMLPAGAYMSGSSSSSRDAPQPYTWGESSSVAAATEEGPDLACLEYLLVRCFICVW